MKIYTKRGDKGETHLFDNACVAKDSRRVEAYGAVDELNAVLGLVRAEKPGTRLEGILHNLQRELFVLGADLATPQEAKTGKPIPRISEDHVTRLEKMIDDLDAQLPELHFFILPGGNRIGALLHVARTVCRRAERATVTLAREEAIGELPVKYLNRLSDLLFVLARYANKQDGGSEERWKS